MNGLLVAGGSGRAAAASAVRAGFRPTVIDLFADADTQRLGTAIRCPMQDYPHGLVALAEQLPPMPWMYVGGLENHPNIVDAISRRHSLIGNGGDVLRRVRDPIQLAHAVRSAGGRVPNTLQATQRSQADHNKRWLCKERASCGGLGVQDFDPLLRNDLTDETYIQEFIGGELISGAFDGDRLLGVCRQESGVPWLHAPSYNYSGNIRHDYSNYHGEFERIGKHLASHFSLASRWGLDAIATPECVWFLELNPRYCASMELFERPGTAGVAKAIYYAARKIAFPEHGPWLDSLDCCAAAPDFADIPMPGTVCEPGQPVLTFFVTAPSVFLGLFNMKAKAAELDQLFGVTP